MSEVFRAANSLLARQNARKGKHGNGRSQPVKPVGAFKLPVKREQAIDSVKEINSGSIAQIHDRIRPDRRA